MESIAIVGCGAAGVALLANMSRLGWGNTGRILLIDPRLPGSGIAFDHDEEYLLCNTSVGVNSIFPDDPDHHLRWLRSDLVHAPRWGTDRAAVTADSYVPRGLFLAYLSAQFRRALDDCAARGILVDHLPDSALRITREGGRVVVATDAGDRFPVDRAVVCTGLRTSDQTTRRCLASAGMMWPAYQTSRNLERLGKASRIAVLGMGQSAIDSARLVREHNSDGEIVMLSRSARFPAVRSEMVERPSESLTAAAVLEPSARDRPGSVQRWRRLLRAELYRQDGAAPLFPARQTDPIRQLAVDLEHSRSGSRAWQRIDRHAVTVANSVWSAVPQPQREPLRRWYIQHVRRYVSAVPETVAQELLAAAAQGELRCARTLGEPEFGARGVSIDSDVGAIVADVAIDATGLTAVDRISRTLTPAAVRPGDESAIHYLGPASGDALAIPNYFNAAARQAVALASSLTAQVTRN
ncbi:FAD/NAD(P)-binding protein [Nocardia huaxiensis]|uniref:FAD/NAD(P)-binding protein n=1 Tax=Nocardia huaxiensis TaxID=2755382 RepID=A0A7D6V8B2_9NOCA|nr:FAD/NAD(P)-binding protein [Nocardia huaxiensis]QLY28082.1 FAD/NAD(P)-binding protein [Nocardia huaxiensis]